MLLKSFIKKKIFRPIMKREIDHSKQGKKNKVAGSRFELKIRDLLEKDGCIIDKWTNNVDLEERKVVKAKRKFNPFKRIMTIGTGFPDFISIKNIGGGYYDVVGIEVKSNGYLDQEEKAKCRFLLEEKIFSKIIIVKKGKKKGVIEFYNFREKYPQ